MVLEKLDFHMHKNELWTSILQPYTKLTQNQRLKCKNKNYNTLKSKYNGKSPDLAMDS